MYRIWIAGPRAWENEEPIDRLVSKLISHRGIGELLVMTGGAPGVDKLAEEACVKRGVHVFACRACWPVGRQAGPIRNRVIAQEFQPDALVALHYLELNVTNHRGTQSAIREARKLGIPVKVLKYAPEVAIPSAHTDTSPMGNRARKQRGLPPKPKRAKRRKRKA